MRTVLLGLAAAGTALLALPGVSNAAGTSLTVSTTVAPYCGISLTNVSGSTAAVANGLEQKIATMRLSCNSKTAKLTAGTTNGDLKDSTSGEYINYDWHLNVAPGPASGLSFGPADTSPGNGGSVSKTVGYSQDLANGVLADFSLNLCYAKSNTTPPGGVPQQDNLPAGSPGSSGCAQSPQNSAALGAPAGTYSETFNFDLQPS